MNKVCQFLSKVGKAFRRKEEEKPNEYFMVMVKSRYNEEGHTPETYGGFVFATMEDAVRHRLDVEQFNASYTVIGIQRFESDLELTCATLDYTRAEGHPNPTVTFHYKD